MARIELHPLGTMEVQLGEPVNVGRGPKGSRTVIDVPAVKLTGERINAELATNDAADWATFSDDGKLAALDVRLTGIRERLSIWLRRIRTRHDLSKLDDHLLRDVGLSRFDRYLETAKPFWR